VQPGLSVMPLNILKISGSVNYIYNLDNLQYVDTKSVNIENRYILGKINQHSMGITFRIDYNITPELSIQYYGSPFASVGKYSELKVVTKPRDAIYKNRFTLLSPVLNTDNEYQVSEKNNSHVDYTFKNPDFNFSQFRSNLVFRWEYRPGSQIYLVWSQDRTNNETSYYFVNDAMANLKRVFPKNIFLIKFNYWFSI
jgi:hypothetical protein